MRSFRCRFSRSRSLLQAFGLCVISLAGLASGCASGHQPTYVQGPASEQTGQKVVMEDDGQPAQIAPARRIREQPDDPSEPFSPNYGSKPGDRLTRPSD
jgi:hypothetical protein